MSVFTYKDIYIEDGKRVMEVNILPEKHCNFDCIFWSYWKIAKQGRYAEIIC